MAVSGVVRNSRHGWNREHSMYLVSQVEQYKENLSNSWGEIAENITRAYRVPRTVLACRKHFTILRREGETSFKGGYNNWTEECDAALVELRAQGYLWKNISKILADRFSIITSYKACKMRFCRLKKKGSVCEKIIGRADDRTASQSAAQHNDDRTASQAASQNSLGNDRQSLLQSDRASNVLLNNRGNRWTEEEDDFLLTQYALLGSAKWERIAENLNNSFEEQRTVAACKQEWYRLRKKAGECESILRGRTRWSDEQNKYLLTLYEKYGPQNWERIAENLNNSFEEQRTVAACKYEWYKLRKKAGECESIFRGHTRWSDEQNKYLLTLYEKYGPQNWETISTDLYAKFGVERTGLACRFHHYDLKSSTNIAPIRIESLSADKLKEIRDTVLKCSKSMVKLVRSRKYRYAGNQLNLQPSIVYYVMSNYDRLMKKRQLGSQESAEEN